MATIDDLVSKWEHIHEDIVRTRKAVSTISKRHGVYRKQLDEYCIDKAAMLPEELRVYYNLPEIEAKLQNGSTVNSLSKYYNVRPCAFNKVFQKQYHQTVRKFLIERRVRGNLAEIKDLLVSGKSVPEIKKQYDIDSGTLNRVFREEFGMDVKHYVIEQNAKKSDYRMRIVNAKSGQGNGKMSPLVDRYKTSFSHTAAKPLLDFDH